MTLDLGMEYSVLGLGNSDWNGAFKIKISGLGMNIQTRSVYGNTQCGMDYQAWEQKLAMGTGIHIILQDYFIVSPVRRWLHTIFPDTGWTTVQLVLWKHMYCYVIEYHMIPIVVINRHFSTHINSLDKLRT